MLLHINNIAFATPPHNPCEQRALPVHRERMVETELLPTICGRGREHK